LSRPHPSQLVTRSERRRAPVAGAFALCVIAIGCAGPGRESASPAIDESEAALSAEVDEIYARADDDRVQRLEFEVERLRTDLREAEESLVAIESGLRGVQGRADAASSLAEARIEVARAARRAPWSVAQLEEARRKLDVAEHQFQIGHSGSAVFFASRARRVAAGLIDEARRVAADPSARYIRGRRVNLRAGPSTRDEILEVLPGESPVLAERREGQWLLVRTTAGRVGWVHESLVLNERSSKAKTQSLPASLAR
jgi:hypothetical protein